jgi:large subunit ribosomal protein L30
MKLKITQIRSAIGATARQKGNLISLRLRSIGDSSIFDESSSVNGRVRSISHLVRVEKC